jgi:hypothetical protein
LWQAIVDTSPAGHFREGDALLTAFCWHSESANRLAKLIDDIEMGCEDLRRLGRLLTMRERETRMLSTLATKMRLTQQARMHPRTAGRAFENTSSRKLWERD